MGMRKTTRYLIRQGVKERELEIINSENIDDVEIFNQIYEETARRHHFTPFSLDYLKKEFLAFSKDKEALIFLAKYKNDYTASSIVVFWQGVAFYHQGASNQKHPKIPSAYLLQWEAIREAKKRGCQLYNFWGIAPEGAGRKHPWWGLTLFKKGFGGFKKEYVRTQDFPLSFRYWFTFWVEFFRKLKRGL
jgi:lipid II:glycine glycyltransferase (peptidoglycan interpeptide bridge formation enzyme)